MTRKITLKNINYFRSASEFHQELRCTLSVSIPSNSPTEGFKKFFDDNGFTVGFNLFNTKDNYKKQVETVYKKLILIYGFSLDDENILFVIGKINLITKDGESILLPENSTFVYDKSRVKAVYEESI